MSVQKVDFERTAKYNFNVYIYIWLE